MSNVTPEADKSFLYTNIADIQLVPTKGKQDEITARILRTTPPVEEIDLGKPEQAKTRIRHQGLKNLFWLGATIASAAIACNGVRELGSTMITIIPVIDSVRGLGEVGTGAIAAIASYEKFASRSNLLHYVRETLSAKTRIGLMQNLDQQTLIKK